MKGVRGDALTDGKSKEVSHVSHMNDTSLPTLAHARCSTPTLMLQRSDSDATIFKFIQLLSHVGCDLRDTLLIRVVQPDGECTGTRAPWPSETPPLAVYSLLRH
jgi:hypothetical protein